ncbi:hypothetical protein [Komagataeibacter sp. FXV3]|uniref:hypothetical protein n=1 Tax=Komagataeibacter sp. FXV3 TaxID=2608998 RepID=UPI00187B337A|nr:hypothetical protein [Komagataeibacter sp. FXV3]MBE7728847.1 hypothetical protein [Komagataeibacter sp. FXV3]
MSRAGTCCWTPAAAEPLSTTIQAARRMPTRLTMPPAMPARGNTGPTHHRAGNRTWHAGTTGRAVMAGCRIVSGGCAIMCVPVHDTRPTCMTGPCGPASWGYGVTGAGGPASGPAVLRATPHPTFHAAMPRNREIQIQ